MKMLHEIVHAFAAIPDWGLMLVPALVIVYTLVTVLFGGRKAYPYVTFCALPLAAMLGAGRGAAGDLVYVGFTAVVAGFSRLVFLLPRRKRNIPCPKMTPSKEPVAAHAERTVWEVPAFIPIERCGLDMAKAREYLARLSRAPLSAGDRLEVEVLTHTLEVANRAVLTEEELARVNDGLAAMYKIAAKYKI